MGRLQKAKKELRIMARRLKRQISFFNPFTPKEARAFHRLRFYMSALSNIKRDVFFIQIGAHDGVTADPIHGSVVNRGWKGLLIEPIDELFEKLQENKKGLEGLIFEKAAISTSNNNQPFYAIREDIKRSYPVWSDMLGSFSKETILKAKDKIPDIENYIEVRDVTCLTFETLLAKHNINAFDLLLIDTEGHDYEILKQVNLAQYSPTMIVYEDRHLSKQDAHAAKTLMRSHGYHLRRMSENIVAIRPGLFRQARQSLKQKNTAGK